MISEYCVVRDVKCNGHDLISSAVLSQHLPGGTDENKKTSVRIIGARASIHASAIIWTGTLFPDNAVI
jgi:hypothetical protein